MIVCSAVYRQAATDNPAFAAIDADNRYLWRQNRRRLDAEAVRDSVLAASGTLDRRMGGPGFEPFSFKDDHSPIYDHSDPAKIDGPQVRRRTDLSIHRPQRPQPVHGSARLRRSQPQHARSQPDPDRASGALALWNDLFMLRQSQELARRLEQHSGRRPRASRDAASASPSPAIPINPSSRPWRITQPSTAWRTPAGCSITPTNSCSSTERKSA